MKNDIQKEAEELIEIFFHLNFYNGFLNKRKQIAERQAAQAPSLLEQLQNF